MLCQQKSQPNSHLCSLLVISNYARSIFEQVIVSLADLSAHHDHFRFRHNLDTSWQHLTFTLTSAHVREQGTKAVIKSIWRHEGVPGKLPSAYSSEMLRYTKELTLSPHHAHHAHHPHHPHGYAHHNKSHQKLTNKQHQASPCALRILSHQACWMAGYSSGAL